MKHDEEIIDCLQLINSENVGPVTFYNLLRKHKDYKSALDAVSSLPKCKVCLRSDAEHEFELAQSKGVQLITFSDPRYPISLRQLNDAPPILYVLGNIDLLQSPLSISIVGARNASIPGRKMASKIAYELSNNQVLVVSGMARGIDSAAHKGAMYGQDQKGPTLAILGTGVDVPYPNDNKDLYRQIIEQGAIISEFPLGSGAQTARFPRRNRIVSAFSSGTLVVEATLHSGSLITARLALEQGKDIFAIPGSPQEARSLGPNKLIKDGAILVENADDILEMIKSTHQKQINEYIDKLQKNADIPQEEDFIEEPIEEVDDHEDDDNDTSLLAYISQEGVYVDEIIRASGLDPSQVSLALLELELDGRISRQSGNRVALI